MQGDISNCCNRLYRVFFIEFSFSKKKIADSFCQKFDISILYGVLSSTVSKKWLLINI